MRKVKVRRTEPVGLPNRYPILFIHGMWEGAWVWEKFMPYFAGLGYTCYSLELRGRPGSTAVDQMGRVSIHDYIEDVRTVSQALGNPVLVGHSMGGLLALKLAEILDPPAAVAITPAPPRGIPALRTRPLFKATLRHLPEIILWRPITTSRSEAEDLELNRLPEEDQERVFARMIPESGRVAFEIAVKGVPVDASRVNCPLLMIGAADDRITPAAMVQQMARKYGAQYREFPGHGHMIVLEPGWEKVARKAGKWLGKAAGE